MQITLMIAVASAVLGLFLMATAQDRLAGFNKTRLLCGLALTFLFAPAAYCWDQMGVNKSEIVFAIGGIIGGVALIRLMLFLLNNTSPWSQGFGEFMVFGWCKWDDFGKVLIFGVFALVAGLYTLFSSTARTLEYKSAYESIEKCQRLKVAQSNGGKNLGATYPSTTSKVKVSHKHSSKRAARGKKLAAAHAN